MVARVVLKPKKKRKRTPEAEVLAACLEYLRLKGIPSWRNNTGAGVMQSGHFLRYGQPGSGDIFAILPAGGGFSAGRFCSFEAKAPGGNPTPVQEAWMESVRASGGVACVVRSVADLQKALLEAGIKD